MMRKNYAADSSERHHFMQSKIDADILASLASNLECGARAASFAIYDGTAGSRANGNSVSGSPCCGWDGRCGQAEEPIHRELQQAGHFY